MAVGWAHRNVRRLWCVVRKGQSSLEDLPQWLWKKSFNWDGFPERGVLSPGSKSFGDNHLFQYYMSCWLLKVKI